MSYAARLLICILFVASPYIFQHFYTAVDSVLPTSKNSEICQDEKTKDEKTERQKDKKTERLRRHPDDLQ